VACESLLPQYKTVIADAKVRLKNPQVPTRQTQGAARLHTKTVDEMRQNAQAARENASETDKAKER